MPFTEGDWSSPESNLEAGDYCAVCLIDVNPAGKPKTKDNCKLPIRSKPGAPINWSGVVAAAAALAGSRGGVDAPADAKRKAAKRLVGIYREHGDIASPSLYRIAGMTRPKEKKA